MWCRQRGKPVRLGPVDDAVVGDRTQVPPSLVEQTAKALPGSCISTVYKIAMQPGVTNRWEGRFEMVKLGTRSEEWEPYGPRNSLARLWTSCRVSSHGPQDARPAICVVLTPPRRKQSS